MTDPQSQARAAAEKLTGAQRKVLTECVWPLYPGQLWASAARALERKGLAETKLPLNGWRHHALTPLGLAVRAILLEMKEPKI